MARSVMHPEKAKAEEELHSPSGRSAPSIEFTTRIGRTSVGAREFQPLVTNYAIYPSTIRVENPMKQRHVLFTVLTPSPPIP